jgi:Fur family transcriptional regulator, zinc uptake regulator
MIDNEVNTLSHDAADHPHLHHPHHHDAGGFVRAVEHASEERGLRLTPLRREVLELVAAAHKPVKAYDLLDRLREKHGNAAPPTVIPAPMRRKSAMSGWLN